MAPIFNNDGYGGLDKVQFHLHQQTFSRTNVIKSYRKYTTTTLDYVEARRCFSVFKKRSSSKALIVHFLGLVHVFRILESLGVSKTSVHCNQI